MSNLESNDLRAARERAEIEYRRAIAYEATIRKLETELRSVDAARVQYRRERDEARADAARRIKVIGRFVNEQACRMCRQPFGANVARACPRCSPIRDALAIPPADDSSSYHTEKKR